MKIMRRAVACLLLLATVLGLLPAVRASAAISTLTFQERVDTFLADDRWKPGTPWVYGQRPKLSGWGSIGCCSFAADFVAYVYESQSRAWNTADFTKYSDLNEIRSGDIVHTSTHWFVVLERDGDTLYTAEGNYGSQVRLTREGWGIRNGQLYNVQSNKQVVFDCGYHYNFSDGGPGADVFSDLPGQSSVSATDATVALRLRKAEAAALTAYGAKLFDGAGTLMGQVEAKPRADYVGSNFVDMWYTVSKRFGLTLLPGTKYLYEFWAVVDGETLTSQRRSFTTSAAVAGTSVEQVYYPVEFSNAVQAAQVLHDGDSALAAVASVEAYLYGVASEAEKSAVYAAVLEKSPEGKPVWDNLGYETLEFKQQTLYDLLEQGYPVPVRRVQDGEEAWGIVCGYNGSEVALETAGFIVVAPDGGKANLETWTGSASLDLLACRKNGLVLTFPGEVRFAVNQPPVLHPYKQGHSVYGYITAESGLTKVEISVVSLTEGKAVLSTEVPLGSDKKTANLHNVDGKMTFSTWPEGRYYYTLTAWTADGSRKSLARYFEISRKWPLAKPNPVYTLSYQGGIVEAVMDDSQAVMGGAFTLRGQAQFAGTSFVGDAMLNMLTLKGWYARRGDGKWLAEDHSWLTEAELKDKNLSKQLLPDGYSGVLDGQWIGGSTALNGYTFHALWRMGETVFTEGVEAPKADQWYENGGKYHFISSGALQQTELPVTLNPAAQADAAQAVSVYLGEGQKLTLKLPVSQADGSGVYSLQADGSLVEQEAQNVGSAFTVTLTASTTLVLLGGEKNQSYSRIYGNDRYQTAFRAADLLKQQLAAEKFDAVVVASGTDFADALSGSYLAAVKNAPMLLVRNHKTTLNQVKEYIKQNLASGGTVYLLGGENAVPKTMEAGLEGFQVKRLGGATRYDTNLLILREAGVEGKDILVCTGKDFADSLSASAARLPILLVKDSLNDAQKDFLKGISGKKYIIGGTSAVGSGVENALKAYGETLRLGGNTRYETSVLVAKTFFENPESAVVAYAQNFPDGLSGGALAAAIKVPLILTANGKDKAAADYTASVGIREGIVLGGPALVSDKTANAIFPARTNGK